MNEQMSLADLLAENISGPKVNTPRSMIEDACNWIAPDYGKPNCKFFHLLNLCERAANRGEPNIRRGDLYRIAQEDGLSISVCQEFRFDNNIWSPLSRYLLMFRPKLAAVIHPRENSIDKSGISLVDVWHEIVNPRTFFPVETWREAVTAYEEGCVCAR